MSLRLAKQIIYGAFYLLLWGGVIAIVYFGFLKPAPSCFDNIQNQNETGVDCGGPCAKACTSSAQPIALADVIRTFTIGNSTNFLIKIKNPNADFAAKSFHYAVTAKDATGTVLQSVEGDSFIYANEIKYLFIPNVNVANPDHIDFEATGTAWDAAADFPGPPSLATQNVARQVANGNVVVSGSVVNNDTVPFGKVTVIAVFGGRLGQIGGASATEVDNLAPNSTQQFSILYPYSDALDTSIPQIFVYAARQ